MTYHHKFSSDDVAVTGSENPDKSKNPVVRIITSKPKDVSSLNPVPPVSLGLGNLAAGARSRVLNPNHRQLSGSRHKKCQHGKRVNVCRECGGHLLCKHGKQKAHCSDCRPPNYGSFCKHNRQRSRCKICKGTGICLHGNERYKCKLCRPKKKKS